VLNAHEKQRLRKKSKPNGVGVLGGTQRGRQEVDLKLAGRPATRIVGKGKKGREETDNFGGDGEVSATVEVLIRRKKAWAWPTEASRKGFHTAEGRQPTRHKARAQGQEGNFGIGEGSPVPRAGGAIPDKPLIS